jgi:hypothetical protein
MAGLLNTASLLMCPHGGTVMGVPTSTVSPGGAIALLSTDTFTIAGCLFNPGTAHPCVTVRWVQPATRVLSSNNPALTDESVGLCLAADQAVQGTVQVVSTQQQVKGK